MIESYSVQKQIELLADFMAGAAFARMEPLKPRITERVTGQCADLILTRRTSDLGRHKGPPGRAVLNPRRLGRGNGKTEFLVLRNWRVEPLANNALIGTMPEDDPTETKCSTSHPRTLDFLAMAAAVSTWRTFGDRPATESHGTPAERYDAFSLGYETAMGDAAHTPAPLSTALRDGIRYLEIGS
jgi:hypothetical protein